MNNGKITEQFSLENLINGDIITGTGEKILTGRGYTINIQNKIAPIVSGKHHDVPWVYVRSHESRECGFWHQIVFDVYKYFPVGCLNCWKVVVRPRTVKELFQLHEYQSNVYPGHCKCGIETRPYVHGNYGGYFYNDSLNKGLESYRRVRADINRYISPDISVILKRACTEYEVTFGDSSKWEENLLQGFRLDKDGNKITILKLEVLMQRIAMLRANIDLEIEEPMEGISYKQPGFVKVKTMRSWLEHAYSIGDKTALEFNQPDGLFYAPSKTYHDREITDTEKESLESVLKGGQIEKV